MARIRDRFLGTIFRPSSGRPAVPKATVVHAVGDIHGRSDLLDNVFARIDADRALFAGRRLIEVYLGDYVDRGPDSRGVIDRLIARAQEREVVLLRGNHDEVFEELLTNRARLEFWVQFGGLETMQSYGVRLRLPVTAANVLEMHAEWVRSFPSRHRQFFSQLTNCYSVGDYFFVHAGIRPGVPLERQSAEDMMWIREEFHRSGADHGKMVVHAHTPVKAPEFRKNRINIDTGAYLSGSLTCLRLFGTSQDVVT